MLLQIAQISLEKVLEDIPAIEELETLVMDGEIAILDGELLSGLFEISANSCRLSKNF